MMKEFMQFFVDNWYLIVTFICVIIVAIQKIVEFISLPTAKKIEEVKARLLIWVTDAENELGSGTGALKFAQVYDKFCTAFPYLKKWITIDQFKVMVDDALKKMEEAFAQKAAKAEAKAKAANGAV